MLTALAQDPNERFDLVRPDGTPLGRTKTRAEVHRDGDWHRAVHIWIAGRREHGDPFLLFQRRGLGKDTWPGALDVTVGGHFGAGEALREVLRESVEEIGVEVTEPDLDYLGTRRAIYEGDGVRDYEIQEVFLRRDDRPLSEYLPHPVELAALVRVPLAPLLDVLAGDRDSLSGEFIAPGSVETAVATVHRGEFIATIDRYFYRVAIAAAARLRGSRHVAI